MVVWLIHSAVRVRRLVVAAVVLVIGLGVFQLRQASVDVYPDFKPTEVQIQTEALGLSTIEVEQLITVPLEQNLLVGIPRVAEMRSRSLPGLSVIDMTFDPGTPLYLARQLVQERLTRTRLLPSIGQAPSMLQPTSALSRVAMIGLRSASVSLIDMSVLARWQIRPRLMSIPGVANVDLWGVRDRQLQVQVDPNQLVARHVTLTQLVDTTGNALWVSPLNFVKASVPGTGGFVESPNQRIGVHHVSPVTTAGQLADLTVPRTDGTLVRLGDVATVTEDHQPLIGDATVGADKGLMLVVERLPGADVAQVTRDVDAALAAMRPGLRGVTVDATVFRPASYLDSALGRLGLAALLGLLAMVLAIAVVSLSWRVTLITSGTVAFSCVVALWVLHLRGSTLTTMTVLGLMTVLALVVDDAVGDVATIRTRFDERRGDGRSAFAAIAIEAGRARRGPLMYATIAILVAVAPLLLLTGTAGVFGTAAVLSFVLAALASMVAALVVTPTLAVLLLARASKDARRVGAFPKWVRRGVGRVVVPSVGRRIPAVLALAVLVALAVAGTWQLRPGRPLPSLQDRSVLVGLRAAPGTSLSEMERISGRAAAELRAVPGVQSASTHVGRAVGSDVIANVDSSEIWLTLDGLADQAGTLSEVRTTLDDFPGLGSTVHTYAEARLGAMDSSAGGDLVVRVNGQDVPTLQSIAEQVRQTIAAVPGVISPKVEIPPAQPVVEVKVDIPAAQRYGLVPGDIRRAVSTLVSGLTVGSLYQQQAIFDVVVVGVPAARQSVDDLLAVRVDTPSGATVPLGSVASVGLTSDPPVVTHHAATRNLDVTARIQGRSHDDVARDVTSRLQALQFPYQYDAAVVGQGTASGLPAALLATLAGAALLVFLLIQAAVNSWRGALVVFVCAALAGVGGLFGASFLRGVGSVPMLTALFAVTAFALRQALVLVNRAQRLAARRAAGDPVGSMRQAVVEESPAMLAAVLVSAAAFAPAAVMTEGAGLEILHPFAVVLLAGLVTSATVVLFLVPVLYVAVGGLRNRDGVDDDVFRDRHEADAEPGHELIPAQQSPGKRDSGREAGITVSFSGFLRTTALAAVGVLALAGCQAGAGTPTVTAHPAAVSAAKDGGPPRITLQEEAETRIGLETTASGPGRTTGKSSVIPYGAVVYDTKGATWTFVRVERGVYQRAPITVATITGNDALLTSGPPVGTQVVTVGAAELVGVEAGISGEQ